MIVIPKETPLIGNLNSYYVKIGRLVEHFQGEVGCGGLYFKSSSSEGILFFDKDEILNGIFAQKGEEITGSQAIERLIQAADTTNYSLSVYRLRPDDIYFWSTIPDAKRISQDLTTEFTDLEGLTRKMKSEGLTGFIEVFLGNDKGGGLVFFNNGQISGGSYSWGRGESARGEADQAKLIQLTKDNGGSFHVSRIVMQENGQSSKDAPFDLDAEELSEKPSLRIVTAMSEMLAIFERTVHGLKTVDNDFATLLNRKFVEKADRFPFLDPFAAEFKYADGKILIEGDTTDDELTNGICESIRELADELDALPQLRSNLATWQKKYKDEVEAFAIAI